MSVSKFQWRENGDQDDFICHIDGHVLRAEQMQDGVWWWCCYPPNQEPEISSYTHGNWAKDVHEAKYMAENAFYELSEVTKIA